VVNWREQAKARFEVDLHRSVMKNAAGAKEPLGHRSIQENWRRADLPGVTLESVIEAWTI